MTGRFTEKEDIMFAIPLSRFAYPRFSLGILSICAYLREKGFQSAIIEPHKLFTWNHKFKDLNEEEYKRLKENFTKHVAEMKPKLLCFSCATREFNETIEMIEAARKVCDAKIIVGGYHANVRPEEFFTYKKNLVDFVVYGEGEITMHELAEALSKEEISNEELSRIDGLVWKDNDKIIRNKPRALIEDLDILPVPAYDMIDMKRYTEIGGFIKCVPLRSFTIVTSRGCPFECTFCSCNAIFGRKIRFRSEKSIEEEIKKLKEEYDVEGVWFGDDALTTNPEHFKKVCKIAKKYGILWSCTARVSSMNDDVARIMRESGGVQVNFGVESGNQRVLDEIIKKRIDLNQVKNAVKASQKNGIQVLANFMIGLPGETEEELQETIDFALDIDADCYASFITVPFPGTELYDMVGIKINPKDYYKIDYNDKVFHKQFNKSDVKDLDKKLKEFRRLLMAKTIAKTIKSFPEYIKIWRELPSKTKRFAYVMKNVYNRFVFKPIFKRSLRL